MGAKENLAIVEQLQRAARDRDWDRYGELLADNARFRMAGVPQALGGLTTGRDAVVAQMRQNAEGSGTFEVRDMFADDSRVCLIGKVSAPRFSGNKFFQGVERPFSTYECIVYRLEQGRVHESTAYVNWLDAYTQLGLVDPASFTA